ncbi:MAG: hypothetical protein IJG86_06020 [Clostridia bacterium]|nr:hypothetical protein [Clostridia bacterium]
MRAKSAASLARSIPERDVVKAVLNFFAPDRNISVWRRNTGAVTADYANRKRFIRFGQPGMSDVWGIITRMTCPECGRVTRRGVHLEIECKKFGGKLTAAQKEYLEMIRKRGGIVLVAIPFPSESDPTGFGAIRKKLETIDKELCEACSRR